MSISLGDLTGLGSLADAVKAGINKVWPDKTEVEKAELAAQLQPILGQIEINKAEASNPNWFVAGWRPAIGWVGAISLALMYWPKAIVMTVIWCMQSYSVIHNAADITQVVIPVFPDLGVTDMIGLLGSMLGVGVMRTVEKTQQVNHIHN